MPPKTHLANRRIDANGELPHVYDGENWNPKLRAPLTQSGVNVHAGDYLLAVSGRDVRPPADVYSFFEETAGKQVVLKVGARPERSGSREVIVVPVDDESSLGNYALDRRQSPQSGRANRWPRGVRLLARYLRGRLPELQSLLLRAGRQGRGHHR